MTVESHILSDSAYPTYNISCLNKSNECSSTQQNERFLSIQNDDQCFKEKGDLKRLQRTHTDEKPDECSTCDKCFLLKGDLKSPPS